MGLTAVGAGKGSRTLLSTLGRSRSTDELYLHQTLLAHYSKAGTKMQAFLFGKFRFFSSAEFNMNLDRQSSVE